MLCAYVKGAITKLFYANQISTCDVKDAACGDDHPELLSQCTYPHTYALRGFFSVFKLIVFVLQRVTLLFPFTVNVF